MQLTESGFANYRCDSNAVLGIQFAALNKILKCMTSKDSLSIQAQDDGDIVNFIFESADQKRYSNFELKLNDIDAEQLGIPDTDYATTVKMPSAEFQRICRDLAAIGDTVTISATKQGVQFAVDGDIGAGSMMIKGFVAGSAAKLSRTRTRTPRRWMTRTRICRWRCPQGMSTTMEEMKMTTACAFSSKRVCSRPSRCATSTISPKPRGSAKRSYCAWAPRSRSKSSTKSQTSGRCAIISRPKSMMTSESSQLIPAH